MRELRTFLAKVIPSDIKSFQSSEIIDIYIPKSAAHSTLRIRKNGDKYEITKKEPRMENDSSDQNESIIILIKTEFDELKNLDGKSIHKIRYYYEWNGRIAEIDIFQDGLSGTRFLSF